MLILLYMRQYHMHRLRAQRDCGAAELSWIAEGPKTKFVQATSLLLPNTTYHRPPPATIMSQ
jgi:hypothetical protein